MAEKFPALDPSEDIQDQVTTLVDNHDETDFLKREAEVLGDEFKTEQDADLLGDTVNNNQEEADEEEFDEFTSNSNNTNNDTTVNEASVIQEQNNQDNLIEDDTLPNSNETNSKVNDDAERIISEWKQARESEIAKRDERESKEKTDLQNEAITYIDEFYENYNKKKQEGIEATQNAAKEFLAKRDQFFQQEGTTTWDRALQLINEDDAAVVNGRDRSKFKEILQKLKGKVNAPGA